MSPGDTRSEPPLVADERTSLAAWLDYHRSTLLQKCEGLSGEQMVRQSVPPSGLTLLGLVRHMFLVEWWWFEHIFAGSPSPDPISTPDDPDADFHQLNPAQVDAAILCFKEQCAHSRAMVDAAESLDALSMSSEREQRNLRWVVVHRIEEYARHNGHADLLRECIDGVVGE
jgi:hypothetical protein